MASGGHLPGSLSELDHHASRGFRLTRQSAIELVAAALLAIVAIILVVATILGVIFGQAMRDTATYSVRNQVSETRRSAAAAVEADSSNPYAYSAFAGASLYAGEFEAATRAYEAMGELPRRRLPESALGRAVVLLTDPATAGTSEARSQARSLLESIAGDPDARVMLGQLTLDDGDYAAARNHFQAALAGGDDVPAPSTQGAVVAYNGLGVALLADAEARRSPQRIAEAIGHFNSALAYRQPWSPPLVNRDRAIALWMRASVERLDSRRDIQNVRDQAGQWGGAVLDEYSQSDIRRYSEQTQWPDEFTIAGPGNTGERTIGRVRGGPIEQARRVTLRPAVFDARFQALADYLTLDAAGRLLRQVNEEMGQAENAWGERWATRMNRLAAQLHVLELGTREGSRVGRVDAAGPWLEELVGENFERTPESLQPSLLIAYWIMLGEAPDSMLSASTIHAGTIIEHVRSERLLERLGTFAEGDSAPVSHHWLRFIREHVDALEPLAGVAPNELAGEDIERLADVASHLAAQLPMDRIAASARDIPLVQATVDLPTLPGEVRFGEVATLVYLYEHMLRRVAEHLQTHAGRASEGSPERAAAFTQLRNLEQARARLLGYIEATGGDTLDGQAARREVSNARNRIRDARRALGE